ncbi:solute carrier family 35 member G1-like [Clavelina lepadiformis]|uniref:EamA domain-containing protein n=1 Tax=Clavelina lepadiformis TaxID=159417 RepID=A0ABP0F7B7_CLALP
MPAMLKIVGIFLSFLGALMLSLGSLMAKLTQRTTASQINYLAYWFSFIIFLPVYNCQSRRGHKSGSSVSMKQSAFTAVFLLSHVVSSGCTFAAMQYIKAVGDVLALCGLYPMWTLLMSRIFLKEKVWIWELIIALLVIAGVVLIARPSFLFGGITEPENNDQAIGVVFCLVSSIFTALTIVTAKKLVKNDFLSTQMFLSGIVGIAALFIFLSPLPDQLFVPCLSDMGFVFSGGFFICFSRFFVLTAVRYEKPGTVMIAYSSQIVVSYLFDALILRYDLQPLSLLGGALVLSGIIVPIAIKLKNSRNLDIAN